MRQFVLSLFAVACITLAIACGSDTTVTGPDTTSNSPVATTPVASATPTPQPANPPADPPPVFTLNFFEGVAFELFYNGGASYVEVSAFVTSFDNQDLPLSGVVKQTIATGKSWNHTFGGSCVQLDVDQPGVKLIGAAFYDKQGKTFVPSRNPEKVAECRACVPTYTKRETITYEGRCEQRVKITTTYTLNSCTKTETSTTKSEADPEKCQNECEYEEPYGTVDVGAPDYSQGTRLDGPCPESFNLDTAQVCYQHRIGTQATLTTSCNSQTTGSRQVCVQGVVDCPQTCQNTAATSNAAQKFELGNSGIATELAWVNANTTPAYSYVHNGQVQAGSGAGACVTAAQSAKVVLLKAGGFYIYFLNVTSGAQLCNTTIYNPPGNALLGVSHTSYFNCS